MPDRPDRSARLRDLLRWLLGITRPVHPPLLASLAFRVVNLTLDLALFATAAAGVVRLVDGDPGLDRLLLTLVVLALAKALAYYGEQFTGHYVAFKALELLRGHVFSRLWPKAPAIVAHSRSGDLLTSLTRDVDRIEVVYAHTFAPVVSAYLVGGAAVVVAGSWAGWSTVAVAVACLAVSLLVVPYAGTRASMRATRRMLAERRALTHEVTDTIAGLDEVLGYGRGDGRLERMDARGRRVAEASRRPRDLTGLRRGANVVLSLVATGSVVVLGAGDLPTAAVAALAAATLRVFEGPRGIEDATGFLDHSLAAARRLWEICHAPERVHDGARTLDLARPPTLRVEGVSYAYPGAWETRTERPDDDAAPAPVRYALRDVTLTIPASGHVIVVGRSGSGKSTLVQLLQRYDDPSAGRVLVDGVPAADYTLDSLRRSIVSVSQRSGVLQGTIAENLRLGAPDASEQDLWRAMETAGLAGEVRAMPDRLHTHVGTGSVALSGGQVQRLCLARALVMEPRVLVLDEFTSSLDVALEARVRSSLRAALPDATIVEVTHRLRATAHADVIAVLDRGRVIASGTPREISQGAIEELFRESASVL